MPSPQTLSETERRLLAGWAASCAEHVLPLFEAERPSDKRPRDAIQRSRAYSEGRLDTASEIRRRFADGGAAKEARSPAAAAAARAAGQASAVCHMAAHALGAAAYAVRAAELAAPDDPAAAETELGWQVSQATSAVRMALRSLPPVGENRSGPLGPGLLSSGRLGEIIAEFQARL